MTRRKRWSWQNGKDRKLIEEQLKEPEADPPPPRKIKPIPTEEFEKSLRPEDDHSFCPECMRVMYRQTATEVCVKVNEDTFRIGNCRIKFFQCRYGCRGRRRYEIASDFIHRYIFKRENDGYYTMHTDPKKTSKTAGFPSFQEIVPSLLSVIQTGKQIRIAFGKITVEITYSAREYTLRIVRESTGTIYKIPHAQTSLFLIMMKHGQTDRAIEKIEPFHDLFVDAVGILQESSLASQIKVMEDGCVQVRGTLHTYTIDPLQHAITIPSGEVINNIEPSIVEFVDIRSQMPRLSQNVSGLCLSYIRTIFLLINDERYAREDFQFGDQVL